MWIWKVNSEKTKFGFFKIPKNCVNAEMYRFEELLKTDYHKELKSAIINWFSEKHNHINFNIGMNGYDSILLITDNNIQEEIHFNGDFSVKDDYLIHYDNEQDWINNRGIVDRSIKIDKILTNVKKLQKSHS